MFMTNKFLKFVCAGFIASSAAFAGVDTPDNGGHHEGVHWGYGEENGPKQWGKLGFETCANGKAQSPINIIVKDTKKAKNALSFAYKSDSQNIVNNGHSLQVNFDKQGTITFKKKKYNLVQLHFHTPSENHIDGKEYPLEMHLVHASSDNKFLVVAVFFDEGRANQILQDVVNTAPAQVDSTNDLTNLNVGALLPKSHSYYAFMGSLTTPPCTEGVQFVVLKDSVQASKEQIEALHAILHDDAREPQALNGRVVEFAQ
ncbi:carbonic anhydrase [Helicobacter jaachi]|nr:carbonic anhydrase family protein [Helicobacter jaachi]